MARYRARDLLLVPSLLSLARLPLAAAFLWVVDRPGLALAVLVFAGVTDVLDGWYARRFDQATPTGAVADGIADKAFVAAVVAALIQRSALDGWGALLLAVRELGELPLVLWWAFFRHGRKRRAEDPRANHIGKLATVAQFAAVAGALFQSSLTSALLYATALLGAVAAASYWKRELSP